MEITKVLNEIKLKEGAEFGKSLSDKQIEELEIKLEVKLVDTFKFFLKNCGFISSGGFTVFGVSEEPYNDIIRRNKMAREEELPADFAALPDDAYIIAHYPGGGYYVQYAKGTPREGQIGLILDETFYEEEGDWPDLESFLKCYFL